jgi:arylsulfatase A-like enzyme
MRADILEAYGFPGWTSPVMGRLAREGVVFENCYSPTTWTRPAAATIVTSLSPLSHGVTHESHTLIPEIDTLAEVLRRSGWYTAAFLTNANAGRGAGLAQGFDVVFEPIALFRFATRNQEGFEGSRSSLRGPSGSSELIAHRLREWLPAHRDLPLFLYVHPNDPHGPYNPREPFASLPGIERAQQERKARRAYSLYGGDVRAAVHFLGDVLREFERAGLLERTAISLVADHGEEFLDHQLQGHGENLFEETLRVPLLLRAPWVLPSGIVHRGRVGLTDIMPTLLDLLGVPAGRELEGKSLVGLVPNHSESAMFPRGPAFAHLLNQGMRLKPKVMADPDVMGEVAVLRDHWKFIVKDYGRHDELETMLFDLREDPGELRNLVAAEPGLASELERLAREWYRGERLRSAQGQETLEIRGEDLEKLRALGYID